MGDPKTMVKRVFSALAVAFVAIACSGITTQQDFVRGTDFSGLRTYDWMPDLEPSRDPRGSNDLVDNRIRSAVESGLQAKGIQKATSGNPDFMVGFHLILQDKTDYHTVNDYYGGGWGYGGMYDRSPGLSTGPAYSTGRATAMQYTEGTLVLDFFDNESKELVWRGVAEGKVQRAKTPQQRQERAEQAVQMIMKHFPPNG
jgi:hypothetical protein